jgi:hypothetical protein
MSMIPALDVKGAPSMNANIRQQGVKRPMPILSMFPPFVFLVWATAETVF